MKLSYFLNVGCTYCTITSTKTKIE